MNIREFLITSDACISLSSEAKRELQYVCEEINKQIIDQSKKIDDVINDKFGQALKDVDVLEKKILQLKEAKDILNSE